MKEALGGSDSKKSAYCLIYVNEFVKNQTNNQLSPIFQAGKHYLSTGIINKPLQTFINQQNMDFSQEIQRYKMEQIVNKINIKNKQRYDEI
jgi:hypothetical protein